MCSSLLFGEGKKTFSCGTSFFRHHLINHLACGADVHWSHTCFLCVVLRKKKVYSQGNMQCGGNWSIFHSPGDIRRVHLHKIVTLGTCER